MIRSHCALLALAVLLFAHPAAAEVYKWIDEQGVTHYSQQPPPEGARTIIEPDPAPPSAKKAADEGDGDKKKDNGPSTISEFCQQLRKNEDTLASDRPVRVKADDGTLTALDDEARATRLKEVRGQLADHCQDVDSGG